MQVHHINIIINMIAGSECICAGACVCVGVMRVSLRCVARIINCARLLADMSFMEFVLLYLECV